MVRLLLCPIQQYRPHYYRFQSHNGAIAARWKFCISSQNNKFQSHNGAIAAIVLVNNTSAYNPFQSHNGAIAACPTIA